MDCEKNKRGNQKWFPYYKEDKMFGLDAESMYKLLIFDLYSTMHTCAEEDRLMEDTENSELSVAKPFISNLDKYEGLIDVELISSIISKLLVFYYNTRVKERVLTLNQFNKLLDVAMMSEIEAVLSFFRK